MKGRWNYLAAAGGATLLLVSAVCTRIEYFETQWRALPWLCFGIGVGLLSFAVSQIITRRVYRTHPELARQEGISARDERNVALGNAAKARAFALFSIGFPWILMIFALLELETLPLLVLIGFYLLVEIVFLAARVRLEREN